MENKFYYLERGLYSRTTDILAGDIISIKNGPYLKAAENSVKLDEVGTLCVKAYRWIWSKKAWGKTPGWYVCENYTNRTKRKRPESRQVWI